MRRHYRFEVRVHADVAHNQNEVWDETRDVLKTALYHITLDNTEHLFGDVGVIVE